MCAGKPEKVRTSPFFVAPILPCVAGAKKGKVVFSGLLFFGSFLLEGQKKGT
jgi:hypothetical protein